MVPQMRGSQGEGFKKFGAVVKGVRGESGGGVLMMLASRC